MSSYDHETGHSGMWNTNSRIGL